MLHKLVKTNKSINQKNKKRKIKSYLHKKLHNVDCDELRRREAFVLSSIDSNCNYKRYLYNYYELQNPEDSINDSVLSIWVFILCF
jgi:DNA-directed RNA polymerase specialized sigma24 family protein